jgi:hypothetical protein
VLWLETKLYVSLQKRGMKSAAFNLNIINVFIIIFNVNKSSGANVSVTLILVCSESFHMPSHFSLHLHCTLKLHQLCYPNSLRDHPMWCQIYLSKPFYLDFPMMWHKLFTQSKHIASTWHPPPIFWLPEHILAHPPWTPALILQIHVNSYLYF